MDLIYAINAFHKRNLREAHKEKIMECGRQRLRQVGGTG